MSDLNASVKTPSGTNAVSLSALAINDCAIRIVAEFILHCLQRRGKEHCDCGPLGSSRAGAREGGWAMSECAVTASDNNKHITSMRDSGAGRIGGNAIGS